MIVSLSKPTLLKCIPVVPGLVLLGLLNVPSVAHADPANYSGLKDTDLTSKDAVGDVTSAAGTGKIELPSIGDVLGSVLNKNKNKGIISRVHVVADRPESLTVQIAFGELKGDIARTISVSAADEKNKPLRGIQDGRAAITGTQGEAVVKLEISPDVAGGAALTQTTLLVQIGKSGTLQKEVFRIFQCPKNWLKHASTVAAEPIGKSRTLPATKPGAPAAPIVFMPFRMMRTPATVKYAGDVAVKTAPPVEKPVASSMTPAPVAKTFATSARLSTLLLADRVVGLPTDVKNNNGQGPGTSYLRLFDGLELEAGVSEDGLTSLHPNIYEDANPASGFFYYLPRGYYLYWDADTGYGLRILYGASASETATNNVSVAARLTTGITGADIALARTLLQKYCQANGRTFKELKPFPFSNMAISLKNDVGGQYNIPADKISVNGITDIAGMIDFSLTTDPVTKENLQLVLTQGLGVNGQVTYQSASDAGAGGLQVTIPLRLKFGDRNSFGARPFTRGAAFQNAAPFSFKLKNVNVLSYDAKPIVYSYTLADTEVPAGASIAIDGSKVPTWLDTSAQKMWIDYAVVADDEDANRKALEAVTGGVTSVAQAEISFRALTPLQDTGAALVLVTVSSKYFDPKGTTESVKTIELSKDNEVFKIKPIYLVNRQAGDEKPGDPLFKFKLTVVKADGTSKESNQWTPSNGLTIYIGKAQIQPILGPSAPTPPAPAPAPAAEPPTPAPAPPTPATEPAPEPPAQPTPEQPAEDGA